MGHLDEKVVIVTGAGGGIGRVYVCASPAEGVQVVVNDYGGGDSTRTSEAASAVVAGDHRGGRRIRSRGQQRRLEGRRRDRADGARRVRRTALRRQQRRHRERWRRGDAGEGLRAYVDIHLGGTVAVTLPCGRSSA